MNNDEKFNHYVGQMLKHAGADQARRLETALSQMLEMKCSSAAVWQYAARQVNAAIKEKIARPLGADDIAARARDIPRK
jgi:hypothetical protein